MLFNLELDPHELNDVSPAHPEVVNRGLALLKAWHDRMMRTGESQIDPMRTVLAEGGPFHSKGMLNAYAQRLRACGRAQHAETILARHQSGEWRSRTEP